MRTKQEALLREAETILREDPEAWAWRTCWECNSAHEHLKDPEFARPMLCMSCGNWFFRGEKLDVSMLNEGQHDE